MSALQPCTADSIAASPTISPEPSCLSPMVIELFSGTGGVTAALRSFGFDAVGIDKIHLKHALAAPMLLDVARSANFVDLDSQPWSCRRLGSSCMRDLLRCAQHPVS